MENFPATLFYTIGYPGSGKTTFSLQLKRKLGLVHLYADEIGVDIFRIPKFSPQERRYLYEEMNWQAENHLKSDKGVIYDANINSLALRNNLRSLAKRVDAIAVGLWLNTPQEIALERLRHPRRIRGVILNNLAGRNASERFYEEVTKNYTIPKRESNIIEISGVLPFTEQYKVFELAYKKIIG